MDVDPASATPNDKEGKDKGEGKDKEEKKDHGQHPPAKKYRMTESMKGIVWQLVLLSNECCRLENEKKWVSFLYSCFVGAGVDSFLLVRWRAR